MKENNTFQIYQFVFQFKKLLQVRKESKIPFAVVTAVVGAAVVAAVVVALLVACVVVTVVDSRKSIKTMVSFSSADIFNLGFCETLPTLSKIRKRFTHWDVHKLLVTIHQFVLVVMGPLAQIQMSLCWQGQMVDY